MLGLCGGAKGVGLQPQQSNNPRVLQWTLPDPTLPYPTLPCAWRMVVSGWRGACAQGMAMGAQVNIVDSVHIFIAIAAHKGLAAYALGSSVVDSQARPPQPRGSSAEWLWGEPGE